MPDACYALLAATTSGNKLEAPAIDGTVQAVNELYICYETQPNYACVNYDIRHHIQAI